MIREGKVQDIPQILHVIHDSIHSCILDHQRDDSIIQTRLEGFTQAQLIVHMLYNDCWVYSLHDKVVGFLMVSDQGEILMHFVSTNMQRMGYGSLLYHHMLHVMREKGIAQLEIESTKTALHYYNKLGFLPQHRVEDEHVEPELHLFKNLT